MGAHQPADGKQNERVPGRVLVRGSKSNERAWLTLLLRGKRHKRWQMAIRDKAASKMIQRYFATELEVRRLRDRISLL